MLKCLDKNNNKEFKTLLSKLHKQIVEKRMKIDSPSYPHSSEKNIQPSKDAQSYLDQKISKYFNQFETPQVKNNQSKYGSSAKRDSSSMTKANSKWTNSNKISQNIYNRGIFKFRNNNTSSSLKRVLEKINPSQLRNIKNRVGFLKKGKNQKVPSPFAVKERVSYYRKPNTTAKKIKGQLPSNIGGNYQFKNRKVSSKTRKNTESKWKKRSRASDTSGSHKNKHYVKDSRSGARKLSNKSKPSDAGGLKNTLNDNSTFMKSKKLSNKACKLEKNKDMMSRNSLQSRKNNYNPVETPHKKAFFQGSIYLTKSGKNTVIKPTQKAVNTFQSMWSAYTDNE